mgnify:CR=1 FL=1
MIPEMICSPECSRICISLLSQSMVPCTQLPTSNGALHKWKIMPSFSCTSVTRAPPSTPKSQGPPDKRRFDPEQPPRVAHPAALLRQLPADHSRLALCLPSTPGSLRPPHQILSDTHSHHIIFLSSFSLISAHAFCACRVCVKCAQTQISRLKNFIFQSFSFLRFYQNSVPMDFMISRLKKFIFQSYSSFRAALMHSGKNRARRLPLPPAL